ncbi:MAG: hypothetical protein ACLQMF_06505 [Rectinemataceae bacterium]
MKFIVAFFRFIYDFIIGDCWQIAAGVVIVLGFGALAAASGRIDAELIPILVGIGIVFVALVSLLATTKGKARE